MQNLGWVIAIALIIVIVVMYNKNKTPKEIIKEVQEDEGKYTCEFTDNLGHSVKVTSREETEYFKSLCSQKQQQQQVLFYNIPFYYVRHRRPHRRPMPPPPPMP